MQSRTAKRGLDLIVAAGLLLLLAPLLAALALLVRWDSPGPALFRQQRVGRGFRPFHMLKFRTMTAGQPGPSLTATGDPRITRVGRWLRRWHADELPQLLNVLRGEMSLVGPRPELAEYVAAFRADYAELLRARPGLTDPASLRFRRESELLAAQPDARAYYLAVVLPEKIRLSRDYARQATLWKDLWILWRTATGAGRDVRADSVDREPPEMRSAE